MRQFLLPRDFAYPASDPGDDDYPAGTRIRLDGKDYHYLTHVLRLDKGSRFPGVDRSGAQYALTIVDVQPESLILQVEREQPVPFDPRQNSQTRLYLFQAVLKGKKMDTVIRQATETGVHHIVPLITEHTVVQYDSGARTVKKLDRWDTIIREAMQQSGSLVHPELHKPMELRKIETFWREESTNSAVPLFFHQYPLENASLHGYLSNWPREVALVIGPEGGLSDGETEYLRDCGFLPVHLQTNILRAETAALYAIGAVQSILQEREKWQITPQLQREADIAE